VHLPIFLGRRYRRTPGFMALYSSEYNKTLLENSV
jgi:hypothetical protein